MYAKVFNTKIVRDAFGRFAARAGAVVSAYQGAKRSVALHRHTRLDRTNLFDVMQHVITSKEDALIV